MQHVLVEFDKAGAEWVVVAYLTGDANMLHVVESGEDPHVATGILISGASKELVEKESEIVKQHTDPNEIEHLREQIPELHDSSYFLPRSMSIRQAGKKSNHGLNYNMGYRRFAAENEIPETDSKRIVTLYRESAYPGIPIWHESIKEQLRKDRILTNCFGRKYKFLNAWGIELFDAAFAFLPQSTVVDMVNEGIIKAHNDENREFSDWQFLAQVHDSALGQYPLDNILDFASFCVTMGLIYMSPSVEYNHRTFKIGTTMKVGFSWGSMKEATLSADVDETRRSLEETINTLREAT